MDMRSVDAAHRRLDDRLILLRQFDGAINSPSPPLGEDRIPDAECVNVTASSLHQRRLLAVDASRGSPPN
jgi:hypothetical protein